MFLGDYYYQTDQNLKRVFLYENAWIRIPQKSQSKIMLQAHLFTRIYSNQRFWQQKLEESFAEAPQSG